MKKLRNQLCIIFLLFVFLGISCNPEEDIDYTAEPHAELTFFTNTPNNFQRVYAIGGKRDITTTSQNFYSLPLNLHKDTTVIIFERSLAERDTLTLAYRHQINPYRVNGCNEPARFTVTFTQFEVVQPLTTFDTNEIRVTLSSNR
jgi:hypothetical protein